MSDKKHFDDVTPGGLAAAVVAAGAGAVLDIKAPGVGATTAVGLQSLLNVVGRGLDRRRMRALTALEEAGSSTNTTMEDFLGRAEQDDARIELTLKALDAAARATIESKIKALGRALGAGVLTDDPAIVDAETYIVDALARLEAPHVRVLDIISRTRVHQQNGVIYKTTELAWPVAALEQRYPQAGATLSSVVATLVSLGAIFDAASGGYGGPPPAYDITDFGKLLLARLRSAGY